MRSILFALMLFCQFSCSEDALSNALDDSSTIHGKVVKIVDGDTFDLLLTGSSTRRIRLYGIDCPERGQAFYQAAKEELKRLLQHGDITVKVNNTDVYGRTVGTVYAGTVNINEAMLAGGFSWHYRRYDRNAAWDRLEEDARKHRLGLWSDPFPIAPWTWKKDRRN